MKAANKNMENNEKLPAAESARGSGSVLLACPFCGGKPEVVREGTTRQSCIVECEDCGCRRESNEIGSGREWNQRVMESAVAENLRGALAKVMQWVEAHPRKASIVDSVKNEARAALKSASPFKKQNQGLGGKA